MDIRRLTPTYAVSAQIDIEDLASIKEAGFAVIIDNRPDREIPANLQAENMGLAAAALGIEFHINPIIGGALTAENVAKQAAVMEAAQGPVFAYCASGNRSSIVWALTQAGKKSADVLISIPAQFGYNLEHLRQTLQAAEK